MIFIQNQCSFYEKISDKKWAVCISCVAVICTLARLLYWYKNYRFFNQFSPKIQPLIKEWLENKKIEPALLKKIMSVIKEIQEISTLEDEKNLETKFLSISSNLYTVMADKKSNDMFQNKIKNVSIDELISKNNDFGSIVDCIGNLLCGSLSKDAYIKMLLCMARKDQNGIIFDWTVKNSLNIFFNGIDDQNNTVLHKMLSQELDSALENSFLCLFQEISKNKELLEVKNNNDETIIFKLFDNEQFKKGYVEKIDDGGLGYNLFQSLVNMGIDLNTKNKNGRTIFDFIPTYQFKSDQVNLFWILFKMPNLEKILEYLPKNREDIDNPNLRAEEFFKEQRKNISIDDEILSGLIDPLVNLHDYYADKARKKDDKNAYYYAKSYVNLSQAFKKIRDNGVSLPEITITPDYDVFKSLKFGKEKKEQQGIII